LVQTSVVELCHLRQFCHLTLQRSTRTSEVYHLTTLTNHCSFLPRHILLFFWLYKYFIFRAKCFVCIHHTLFHKLIDRKRFPMLNYVICH